MRENYRKEKRCEQYKVGMKRAVLKLCCNQFEKKKEKRNNTWAAAQLLLAIPSFDCIIKIINYNPF